MRKLGIIGGTSWNSTALYYDHINRGVARRLGGMHSARLVLESLDLDPYARLQQADRFDEAAEIIVGAGRNLAAAGAEAILIASNTTNRYAPKVTEASGLEVLSIADPTIAALKRGRHQKVALLGTRMVMTEDFLAAPYGEAGLDVVTIAPDWIATINSIIFDELVRGEVRRESQRQLRTLITELQKRKVQAVVLACTELVLAVDARANILPVYDTTALHAAAAVDWMLEDAESARAAA